MSTDWNEVRRLCARYGVEFVENRNDCAAYMRANKLGPGDLLVDKVHQNAYLTRMIQMNIVRHLTKPERFAYDPLTRERRVEVERERQMRKSRLQAAEWQETRLGLRTARAGARLRLEFTGSRVELIGVRATAGGTAQVLIDGQPASRAVSAPPKPSEEPGRKRKRKRKPRRRKASGPPAVASITGDRAEFRGQAGERFRVRLVQGLTNGRHVLELVAVGAGEIHVDSPTADLLARCIIGEQWIPENILQEIGIRNALILARDTTLRGISVRDS